MYTTLVILEVILAIALIALVLLQQGKGADAGAAFGSGSSGTVFGAAGGASTLQKITTWLAVGFFVVTLGLSLAAKNRDVQTAQTQQRSLVGGGPAAPVTAPDQGAESISDFQTEPAGAAAIPSDDGAGAIGASNEGGDAPAVPEIPVADEPAAGGAAPLRPPAE